MFVFMVIVGYMVQSKIQSMKYKLLSWVSLLNPITWIKFIGKTVWWAWNSATTYVSNKWNSTTTYVRVWWNSAASHIKNRCAQAWGRGKDSLQVVGHALAAIWRKIGTSTETAMEGKTKMQQPKAETKMQQPPAEMVAVGDEYPGGWEDWW
jgi:hypothetical protein